MKPLHLFLLFIFTTTFSFSQEICNNAIDDDGDGLIDMNDPNCVCSTASTNPTSLIPNPSFELQNCCPSTFSEMYCAQSWVQASDATSDYLHVCAMAIPSISNSALFPFPDGDGAAGGVVATDYKEYIGACLNAPLTAGTQYTIQMQVGLIGIDYVSLDLIDITSLVPNFQWTLYGALNCGNIPYPGIDCPPPVFSVLGDVTLVNDGHYHTLSITFTPTTTISEIVIGSPCTLPVQYPYISDGSATFLPYYVIDNIIINTANSFNSVGITTTGSTCTNDYKLTAAVSTSGGSFQWYENGVAIVGQNTNTLTYSTLGLAGGNYSVTYTINGNCYTNSLDITNGTPINLQVNSGNVCMNQPVKLTATGATTYTWSPSTGLSATTGSTVQASPTTTTVYTITGTTAGCTATTTSTVTVQNQLTITAPDVETCSGIPVNLHASGADTYVWSPATGLSDTTGADVTATVSTNTTYTVVGTSGLCTGQTTVNVTINNTVNFDWSAIPNTVQIPNTAVNFQATPASYNYTWIFDDSTQSNQSNFIHTITPEEGTHNVHLIVQNTLGCIDSVDFTIVVMDLLAFYVPNTFTPDGDKFNNEFIPVFTSGFDPKSYQINIYDRWGELVFESKDTSKGWDGTYKNHPANDGMYTWVIRFKDLYNDANKEIKGNVNVIR